MDEASNEEMRRHLRFLTTCERRSVAEELRLLAELAGTQEQEEDASAVEHLA